MDRKKLFECVKLFEVDEDGLATGDVSTKDIDSHSYLSSCSSSLGIDLCSWRECADHSVLVLFCNNGYLVILVTPTHAAPIIKQLKWFEAREKHILGLAMDPLGEWLACACLEGTLYLLPILSLTKPDHKLRNKFGPPDDIFMIQPLTKKAPPTSVVWWETIDGFHVCITGSDIGELTFLDVQEGREVSTVMVGQCVDHLLLASQPNRSTHLLVGLRGGQWLRQLLEEQDHETGCISYYDAQASGFEVLPNDMVVRSFLNAPEAIEPFNLVPFPCFSEFNMIMAQDWRDQHFLSALNLQTHTLEVFSYDFELLSNPLRTYQLVNGATGSLLMDRMIFVISHNDEADPCSFSLNLLSSQRCATADMTTPTPPESSSVLQCFRIPSRSNLVGYYATSKSSSELAALSHDQSGDPHAIPITNLGGCVIVTTTGVYQCRQVLSPETTFLDLVMSAKSHEQGEEFGIAYRLDVCGLYQEAAGRMLVDGAFKQALKLFELSRCSPSKIIASFSSVGRVPELVHYLHQLVYDDTNHTSLLQPKHIQNVLLRCFTHECLRLHGKPEGSIMVDKFTQFLSEKFLYDQTQAMNLLIEAGLKGQLFDLAKTHHKLSEALEMMMKQGAVDVSHSLQPSLASRQYANPLTCTGNGLFLHQMTPANLARLLYAKPSIIPAHLTHLRSILPQLDIANLLRLARLFDPSHSSIQPLLIKSHSHRRHSNSTGSLISIATSTSSEGIGHGEEQIPQLEMYLETFLVCLIILNHHRRLKPSGPNNLLSLSPLRSAVSGSSPETIKSPTSYTEGSQWVRGSTVSCGMHHAAVVVNANLYTWGATKNGKLGHGDIEEEGIAAPLRVETIHMLNIHVVSVSCGSEHTIALCQEGVFSWGSSSHGQLGHGDTLKKTRPVQITALADKSVVSVVCGQYHSLALDDGHQVWSWGWGVHGQLGLRTVDDRVTPTHSHFLYNKQVSYIAAGYGHSAILTSEGKVFTFGNGMYGQLGHGNTEKQSSPRMVEQLADKIVYLLACGNFHTVVVTTDQNIFCWGKNFIRHRPAMNGGLKEYKRSRERQQTAGIGGGFGSSAASNMLYPVQLLDLELDDTIMQISCGNHHSLLLTSAGSVYAWGSNFVGQLGLLQSGEATCPTLVNGFHDHKVVAIATGDEFSLVVDVKGLPWVWGKGDNGQLGITFDDRTSMRHHHSHHHHHENSHRRSQAIFSPQPIHSISSPYNGVKSPKELSPDPTELPLLELELDWDLPDFAAIDSPHTPYGRKALDAALQHLHGFYLTSHVLWQCEDWKDWTSMAIIANLEQHWPQALRCALRGLVEDVGEEGGVVTKAIVMVRDYLDKMTGDRDNLFTSSFLHKTVDLLENLICSWEEHSLDFSALEEVLTTYLSSFSYPLSLILRRPSVHFFSSSFHLSVIREVLSYISSGHPTPDDIIINHAPSDSIQMEGVSKPERQREKVEKLLMETSQGDIRMWAEILRNLMKDLSRHHSIYLPEGALARVRGKHSEDMGSRKEGETRTTSTEEVRSNMNAIAAFSCGHTHPMDQFQNQIVPEFSERVQDFPIPIPQTLRALQLYYKHMQGYPCACPHCVFQYLRKFQMEEYPKVPITPWTM